MVTEQDEAELEDIVFTLKTELDEVKKALSIVQKILLRRGITDKEELRGD